MQALLSLDFSTGTTKHSYTDSHKSQMWLTILGGKLLLSKKKVVFIFKIN